MSRNVSILVAFILVAFVGPPYAQEVHKAPCGDDNGAQGSNEPVVVGCNNIQLGTCTFSNIGCQPGIANFNVDLSQTGPTGTSCSAKFHVICASGCVASVTLQ